MNENAIKKRLDTLENRARRCVCKSCGGELEVRLISFGRMGEANAELYCPACQKIEFGTEPEIFRNAVRFVDYVGFRYYPEFDNPAETRRLNIAKACEVMTWGDERIGVLGPDGFSIPVNEKNENLAAADGSVIIRGAKIDA